MVPCSSPWESIYRSGFPPGARPAANSYLNGVGIWNVKEMDNFHLMNTSEQYYHFINILYCEKNVLTSVVVVLGISEANEILLVAIDRKINGINVFWNW